MKKRTALLFCILILAACTNGNSAPAQPSGEQPAAATQGNPPATPTREPLPSPMAEAGEEQAVAPVATEPAPTESAPTESAAVEAEAAESALDLTQLWSYGLTSIRTGDPLIEEGAEHNLNPDIVSYGYNLVVDRNGKVLSPRAVPLMGGEQLILVDEYQEDHNTREYARIYTVMAPIRDTILYHFKETTREEWLAITEVLTVNNIKIADAVVVNGRSILSTPQVYDYIASGEVEGSPIVRYLEEAGLELSCLAFKDFDFTNPEGGNHCEEHQLDVGAGIKLP